MKNARLDIYVEDGCLTSRTAQEIAKWVRKRFPQVAVSVMQPHEDPSEQSRLVRATPAYFINGREFSLGNPSPEELEAALLGIVGGAG